MGREPDPVVTLGNIALVMIKVGGVQLEDDIVEKEEAIRESEFEVCGEGKWWVGDEQREQRKAQRRRSSTVLVKVMGREKVGELCHAGYWVGGA